jgi:hypothetical protein
MDAYTIDPLHNNFSSTSISVKMWVYDEMQQLKTKTQALSFVHRLDRSRV